MLPQYVGPRCLVNHFLLTILLLLVRPFWETGLLRQRRNSQPGLYLKVTYSLQATLLEISPLHSHFYCWFCFPATWPWTALGDMVNIPHACCVIILIFRSNMMVVAENWTNDWKADSISGYLTVQLITFMFLFSFETIVFEIVFIDGSHSIFMLPYGWLSLPYLWSGYLACLILTCEIPWRLCDAAKACDNHTSTGCIA